MKKVINFIVNKRIIFIILFSFLALVSIYLYTKVNVNNDISSYLDPKSQTKQIYEKMLNEFGTNDHLMIMAENVSIDEAKAIQRDLEKVNGVASAVFDEETNYKDNNALFIIFLETTTYSKESKQAITDIKEVTSNYKVYLSGSAVEIQFLGDSVLHNMIVILLLASVVVLVIIFINSKSWIEPVIFAIVIVTSILINLGTNAIFKSVSFVTQSICAVMQLALAMDYSIMFLHRYMTIKEENPDLESCEAVKITLQKIVLPILGSSLTTIAGLLALIAMRFRLGMDIGLALSKGIFISLLTTFLFMPGIIIIFSNAISKTKHRNLYTLILDKAPIIKDKVSKFQFKSRYAVLFVLIIIIGIGAYFNFNAKFAYTLKASNDPNSEINQSIDKIESVFGIRNTSVVLYSHNSSLDKERDIIKTLKNYTYQDKQVFTSFSGLSSIYYYDYYTSKEISEIFNLPELLITPIYQNIDPNWNINTKIQVKDIIDYLKKENYINKKFDEINDLLNKLDIELDKLDDKLDPSNLANLINSFLNQGLYNENQAKNILTSIYGKDYVNHTNKEFYKYIINNNYLYNFLLSLEEFENINTNLGKVYTKDEFISLLNITSNIDEYYNSLDNHKLETLIISLTDDIIYTDIDTYNKYNNVLLNKDRLLTYDEVLNEEYYNLYILPSPLYLSMFLLNNKLTIQQIIANILSSNQVKELKEKIDLSNYAKYVKYLDEPLNTQVISQIVKMDESIISSILDEYNITLGNLVDTIKSIIKENTVLKLRNKVSEVLNSKIDLINYAISQFEGKNYNRIIFNFNIKRYDEDALLVVREVNKIINDKYEDTYFVTEGSVFVDFEDAFVYDSLTINILSFIFILLIIALSFRSIIVPLILTILIEGAIWTTLGISFLSGERQYFICYLMVVCIQMGTTIDYGILLTSKYIEERKTNDKITSIKHAYFDSLPTILTSGLILIFASFIVGEVSEVSIISSIGFLLCKGSIISIAFIILALSQILLICDKLIIKKPKQK